MELREYLTAKKITMSDFGARIGRAQSIVSRIVNRKHRPDPSTAVKIVQVTKGEITLDDLYQTPQRYRADRRS